ncbi:hypothetical protein CCAX7_38030 [Capsulimonas corticalis]|uniref:Uncharacterized protein n=1 Tax=Capsulimonas corticalis TaxID=2219043 RepID=A0A402D131_9BACT|nr:hypothetical protein [Capsulimonas corticalis]BDI31752.1 hypothetical protein CCAX7_38030 [Capsulimonas corticalis]
MTSATTPVLSVTMQPAGRVLVIRSSCAIDGSAPSPEHITHYAAAEQARFVLLDATSAPYTDTAGLRWLLRMRDQPAPIRIVARKGGRIWRALKLMQLEFPLFDSVQQAWNAPWLRPGRSR